VHGCAQNFEYDKPPYEASILEGSEDDDPEEAEAAMGASGRANISGQDSPHRYRLFQVRLGHIRMPQPWATMKGA